MVSPIIKVISWMTLEELSKGLKITDLVLQDVQGKDFLYQTILDNAVVATGSYKVFLLQLLPLARALCDDKTILDKIKIVKTMASIIEMLRFRLVKESLSSACPPRNQSNKSGETQDDDPLDRAICRVYMEYCDRHPNHHEIEHWKRHFANGLPFHEFFLSMGDSPEAKRSRSCRTQKPLADHSDNEFVMSLYELLYQRGCVAQELYHFEHRLHVEELTRNTLLIGHFENAVAARQQDERQAYDGTAFTVMGTQDLVSLEDWNSTDESRKSGQRFVSTGPLYNHRFPVISKKQVLVSAIASMYRGGNYIEKFMDNIVGQSIFDDFCELIIIDADSPENEYETIRRYLKDKKRINYVRTNYRIGIYEAWNAAVKIAKGSYITNTNLDDLRHPDSFALQAGVLDSLPFIDVVYQDFFYTFNHDMSIDEVEMMGYKSQLPVISSHNLLLFNSPHNAPMWRKLLHDELGYFDSTFKSAGDYDFWLRCFTHGKKFYKINIPHIIYYQNLNGLSTKADTVGLDEGKRCLKRHARSLLSRNILCSFSDFVRNNLAAYTTDLRDDLNRYRQTQSALRNISRFSKFTEE